MSGLRTAECETHAIPRRKDHFTRNLERFFIGIEPRISTKCNRVVENSLYRNRNRGGSDLRRSLRSFGKPKNPRRNSGYDEREQGKPGNQCFAVFLCNR